ncbi:EamA family transporter, partial [Salmonella enterica subsp. enterica serovar Typhimurium]|uniref:EamA family transporter n=1 Tax=Salmonella enterica TaxID=28901 RepID=UPI000CC157A8
SAATYAFLIGGVACITLFIYNLVLEKDFVGYLSSHWLIFLALAIIPPFLGYGLLTWTVKWIITSIVLIATLFVPIASIFFAYLFL